ncbi:MAG: DnaJ domain-containing protein [Pseudomonadota bacterium]
MVQINYCYLLGLTDKCSQDYKKAYRELSLKFHPDKNKLDISNALFVKIGNANEKLGKGILIEDTSDRFFIEYSSSSDGLKKLESDIENDPKKLNALIANVKVDCSINYYDVFSLNDNASEEDMKTGYDNLVSKFSNLNKPVSDFLIPKLNEAYEALIVSKYICGLSKKNDDPDLFLRKFYIEQNNGINGFVVQATTTSSEKWNDKKLLRIDPIRYVLKTYPKPSEALAEAPKFFREGVDFTSVMKCLQYYKFSPSKKSLDVCGRYSSIPEGQEIIDLLTKPDTFKENNNIELKNKFKCWKDKEVAGKKIDCKIDYYNIFGVDKNSATDQNIKDFYEVIKSKIPDSNDNDKLKAKNFVSDKLESAYEVVSTEENRNAYNELLNNKANIESTNKLEEYIDKFLREYFINKNNGFLGFVNEFNSERLKTMSENKLKLHDPIRALLRKYNDLEEAKEHVKEFYRSGVDFTQVEKCIEQHQHDSDNAEDVCGKYSLYPQGMEIIELLGLHADFNG